MDNRIVCFAALVLLGCAATGFGSTWYVSVDAEPGGDGTSWATAFDTIQTGIDASVSGDTVFVGDGTYTGPGNRDIQFHGKTIKLLSENGPEYSIIDCQGNQEDPHGGFVFVGESRAAVLSGFTITNVDSTSNSAIACYSSDLTITNCIIENNFSFAGAGIFCSESNPTVDNCVFRNNTGEWGSLACILSSPVVKNCLFSNNIGVSGGALYLIESSPKVSDSVFENNIGESGGAVHSASNCLPEFSNCIFKKNYGYFSGGAVNGFLCRLWFTNCLFIGNTSLDGGALSHQNASSIIANCTFVGNESVKPGSVTRSVEYSNARLTNCIIAPFPNDTNDLIYYSENSDTTVLYSALPGGWQGEGNISDDPMITFWQDDYHLLPGSPCIEAGTHLVHGGLPDEDLDGNPRVSGGIVDMGVYEFLHDSGVILSTYPAEAHLVAYGGEILDGLEVRLKNRGTQTVQWSATSDAPWLQLQPETGIAGVLDEIISLDADISNLSAGSYQAVITFVNDESSQEIYELPVLLSVGSTYTVRADGTGQYPTIQAAINAAEDWDTIEVADGVYSGSGNRDITFDGKRITLRSINGPENCIIDCRGGQMSPHRGFVFRTNETIDSVLDGFTIRNGFAPLENSDQDEFFFESGGGIYCEWAHPLIRNCVMQYCSAEQGGAMYTWHGSPRISNCRFVENDAEKGGAIFTSGYSNPLFVNTLMDQNEAEYGGALYNDEYSVSKFLNCTLATNEATSQGGCIFNSTGGYLDIVNTIISGNYASQYPQLFNQFGSTLNISYSLIEGGYMGEGNIQKQPQFVDVLNGDYHLLPESPASDAGSNHAALLDLADVDGDRILHEPVSIDLAGFPRLVDNPMKPGTGLVIDIGAFEYLQDCNTNGLPDNDDLFMGLSADVNGNAVPDECEPDCNENESPDPWDIHLGTSVDCNTNLVPDECEPGCNENGIPDECDIASGNSLDCNTNGIPDECEPGCNANGIPDECDIASGASLDCNSNGIPDECEFDCNTNGIPDDCDLEAGTSPDINSNGLPDECETDCNNNGVFDSDDIAAGTSADTNYNRIPDECEFDCNTNGVPDFLDILSGTSLDADTNGRPDECQVTWFVAEDASTNGDGTSWEQALPAIQSAINFAGTGDTVLVGDGTYTGDGNRDILFIGKAITVQSLNGAASTIIDAQGSFEQYHRGFTFLYGETGKSILRGFTIRNGAHYEGGAISCRNSSPTISDCVFEYNTSSVGAAVSCGTLSSPGIINCVFRFNTATGTGGGLAARIESNPTVTGCLFVGNHADRGGAVSVNASQPDFLNCTFTGNSADRYATVLFNDTSGYPVFRNSIIWKNTGGTGLAIASVDGDEQITIEHTSIEGGWTGEGNMDTDPLLAFDGIDAHLLAGSPCINSANPDATLPAQDLEGTPRVIGSNPDRGALEHNPLASPAIAIDTQQLRFIAYGGEAPQPQTINIRNAGSGTLQWSITQNPSWLSVHPSSGESGVSIEEIEFEVLPDGLTPGNHTAVLTFENAAALQETIEVTVQLLLGSDPIHVRADGFGDYPTIQAAIDAAGDYDLILCHDGIYFGDGNRDIDFLGKPITLRSVSGPDHCILECAGNESENHRGFYFHNGETRDSVLEGFTITGGYSTAEGGAGIYCDASSPMIANCFIRGNTAPLTGYIAPPNGTGGGVYLYQSSPIFKHCRIEDNIGSGVHAYSSLPFFDTCRIERNTSYANGGGALVDASSIFFAVNTLFAGNLAQKYGGGLSNRNEFVLTNCVFSGNSSGRSGGGLFTGSASWSTATNSIFRSNTAAIAGPQIYRTNANQAPLVTFSNIQGSWEGQGNIDADPMFAFDGADYRLMHGSPCIDAGTNALAGIPATDAQGCPRIAGASVDMGLYESVPAASSIGLSADYIRLTSLKGQGPVVVGFELRNTGEGTLEFDITETYSQGDPDWLELTPASGASDGEAVFIQLAADSSQLVVGRHLAVLTISDPAASNNPRDITIEWTINGVIHVAADGSGDYPTIQAAIDAAGPGDVVLCGNGRYAGPGNRNLTFNGKPIAVQSLSGPRYTTIDCQASPGQPHRAFEFISDETTSSVLSGFTITGGYAPADSYGFAYGGAILCLGSSPTITNCLFDSNTAEDAAGAIYCTTDASPLIERCTFDSNEASGLWSWGGGAIYSYSSSPEITACMFRNNTTTGSGGAIYGYNTWLQLDTIEINNCIFDRNTAEEDGGGVYNYGVSDLENRITNCTFYGNEAGYFGGGIENLHASLAVANTVFRSNTAGFFGDAWDSWGADAFFDITWSNFPCDSGDCGETNIDDDPLFANPLGGSFVVLPGSPCIDAGDNSAISVLITKDLAGLPRQYDDPTTPDTGNGMAPVIDMGAYEFQPDGDADRDGDVDLADFAALQACFGETTQQCLQTFDLDANGFIEWQDYIAIQPRIEAWQP